MTDFDRRADVLSRQLSRRGFIKVAAAMSFLAGCRAANPQPTPTPATLPTNTSTPQSTTTRGPSPTPTVSQRGPDELSKVVHTHHAGVWNDEELAPQAIGQMLDASVTELTGLSDASEAWATLFDPSERIAIKVSTISSSDFWTHVPLVMAVTECLQNVGVPAEQIVVFDRATGELRTAGFPINPDGPGVRCYGTDEDYSGSWSVLNAEVMLSDILLNCDALINMPILKGHIFAGCTFAMKSHYGTIDNAPSLHRPIGPAIAGLNALPPIRDRTRLIIGDMLTICTQDWHRAEIGDSILMSADPVAHDMIGLQKLCEVITSQGGSATGTMNTATWWLEQGAELGLGANDPDDIDLVEVSL
jgi:hypothetical protein